MAIITGTFQTFTAVGNRENLFDNIWAVDNTEVPFQTNVARKSIDGTYPEWQTDALAPAGANAHIMGDDVSTFSAITPTTRVGNRTQILRKDFIISRTQESVNKAGRKSEIAYQLRKRGLELRRDLEFAVTQNGASSAGNSSTAATMGGFESWMTANVSRGATGASGGFSAGTVAAPTDGTQRAFTEALLKPVLQTMATTGAKVDGLMLSLGAFNKAAFSSFAGIADQRHEVGSGLATIIGGADVYVSDFGRITAVFNAHQRPRSALLVDKRMAAIAYLDVPKVEKLAKTGDAEKRMIITEATLIVENEKAHGVVADLNDS